MADIQISDLKITGSDLFNDTENYLQDLSDEEVDFQGGLTPLINFGYASSQGCAMGVAGGIGLIAKRVLK
jgi:hypothetical protein